MIWFFGAFGTSINGLIYLYEGLKFWSEEKSRYNSRYVRHYIIVVFLSSVLFAIFAVLYYLFGFYPNPPLNIYSADLTSLH